MKTTRAVFRIVFILCSLFSAAQSVNIDRLSADLKSPDVQIRTDAARQFWELSGKDADAIKPAIPALAAAVLDSDLNIRYMAMSSLKAVGPAAKVAVPFLIKALDTFPGGNPQLTGPQRYYADARWAAADALGAIGPGAKAAIPALQKRLKDPNENVRNATAEALKKIRGK